MGTSQAFNKSGKSAFYIADIVEELLDGAPGEAPEVLANIPGSAHLGTLMDRLAPLGDVMDENGLYKVPIALVSPVGYSYWDPGELYGDCDPDSYV